MNAGTRVRALRTRFGWTQEELSVRAGVGSATVVRLEASNRNPSLITLSKIAGALGVTSQVLLGDEPLPEVEPKEDGGREVELKDMLRRMQSSIDRLDKAAQETRATEAPPYNKDQDIMATLLRGMQSSLDRAIDRSAMLETKLADLEKKYERLERLVRRLGAKEKGD